MIALGKIGNIECAYSVEKTSERDGSKYFGERYTIFFESGDDTHMVDSGWIHCQSKGGGRAILERRGIVIGNVGEMTLRYGFRDYNGRRYPECTMLRFTAMQVAAPANNSTKVPEAAPIDMPQDSAVSAQLAEGESTKLPF